MASSVFCYPANIVLPEQGCHQTRSHPTDSWCRCQSMVSVNPPAHLEETVKFIIDKKQLRYHGPLEFGDIPVPPPLLHRSTCTTWIKQIRLDAGGPGTQKPFKKVNYSLNIKPPTPQTRTYCQKELWNCVLLRFLFPLNLLRPSLL